ncbi:ABC transporter permease subunit [Sinorhizobium meliloti]|nr:ABC transporter permease subunit [Sinorhizobium meliloti]MDX0328136.1 ABC transporter permease subunit [Sinorhizobium meliloti]
MKTFQILSRMPIVLTCPALALLLVVFGMPMILLLLASFKAPDFSLINYQSFFSRPANVRVLYQTLEISGLATAICLVVGYPTAYLIVAASKRLRITLILLVGIPYLTSLLARTYAWIVILGDNGLINNLLLELRLISSPLQLIYNRSALYIGMIHIMLPMMILPLVSVMMGIDKSLMAAARSMGARPLTAFWRVYFPLSMTGVRSGCLLVFVICLGFYITPAALGGLEDAMLSTFIASQVRTFFDIGRVSAAAFVLLTVAFVMLSALGLDLSSTPGRTVQPARKSWADRLPVPRSVKRYLDEFFARRRARNWNRDLYQAGSQIDWPRILGNVFLGMVVFYLLAPELIVVIMSFSGGQFLQFPPPSFSLQWYRAFAGDPSWYGAAWISIRIGIFTTFLSTILGTLAAYGLNRSSPRVRSFLIMAILTPITFPVIVVGIAAYLGLLKVGLLGSTTGVVLAHTVAAIGYVVVIVSSTLANFDPALERAALSMGANPLRTFLRVTLPLIRPGVVGGAVFAFLASLDEVVITSLVGGFSIRTLPMKMWENIRNQIDPTIAAVSSLLILVPVLCLIALYATGWRSTLSLLPTRQARAA